MGKRISHLMHWHTVEVSAVLLTFLGLLVFAVTADGGLLTMLGL